MKKNIKDYLHLYLGCEAIYNGKKIIVCGLNINSDRIQNIINLDTFRIKDIKLILRPLSSMTKDEVKELIKFEKLDREYANVAFRRVTGYNDNLTAVEIDYTIVEEDLVLPKTWTFNFYAMNSHDFHWLLSKHFDVFNLIPEGLAIDATTLKTEE